VNFENKMKTSLFTMFVAAFAVIASASEKPQPALTVAVYDFSDADKSAVGFGSKVTTLVTVDLSTETNLVMLERSELTKALKEQAFNLSGMVSSDAAAKIGQVTGVKVLVSGQVMKTAADHLVIVARIIGTESGRLFTAKVEGETNNVMALASDLSRKIAQTITEQTTNLVVVAQESSAERLDRILKGITGTNRPSVSVTITRSLHLNRKESSATAVGEFGAVLLKAGFPVVDGDSDRKPDIEITGTDDLTTGPRRGGLFSYRSIVEVKVQERRTGNIITFDREIGTATDATVTGAARMAQANAVDGLAERILPLLAK